MERGEREVGKVGRARKNETPWKNLPTYIARQEAELEHRKYGDAGRGVLNLKPFALWAVVVLLLYM